MRFESNSSEPEPSHASRQANLEDVCLALCSDGRSRQMAFLGFKTEAQAKDAMKYFSKTYLDTSKLFVEVRVRRSMFLSFSAQCWHSVVSSFSDLKLPDDHLTQNE
jgi:RNA recognition motif-containing protein